MPSQTILNSFVPHPVLELERQRCAALVAGDLARVAVLASPGLVYVHSPGVVNSLGEFLEFLQHRVRFSLVARREVTLRVKNDTAWMTGLLRYEGRLLPEARPFMAVSFVTQVWSCGDRGWQMEVCQSTRVEEGMWESAPETMSGTGQTADDRFECSAGNVEANWPQ